MSEGVQKEGAAFRPRPFQFEGQQGKPLSKDDVVGLPNLDEAVFQNELHDGSACVDGRHLRMHPEKMREQLEAEERENRARVEVEIREARERKERAQKVIERYRQEDQERYGQSVQEDARKYAAQKEAEERRERQHPEIKHQQASKAINTQLSGLLEAQREQKQEFWSFLPGKRRAVAKLEQEITELRTRARIEQMRIADITNEYHADLKGKRTKEALKPFFDTLKRPERPAPTKEDERASADIARDLIRGLYKEKASLQAEREGWSMLVRPFRRHAIETRLEEVDQEIKDLQEEVRKSARAA